MEKNKKKVQDSLLTAVIAVTATMAFIGGFALSGDLKERIFRASDSNTENTYNDSVVAAAGSLKGKTLGFDERYVVDDFDNDHEIMLGTYSGITNTYITIEYGERKSQLKFTKYTYESENSDVYVIDFPAYVVDVHMSTFDLDSKLNTIFILLEDGNVEYILIEDAIDTNDIRSYGTVAIDKVAKFYEGTTCDKYSDYCMKTAFAQTLNGDIYDLYKYIAK